MEQYHLRKWGDPILRKPCKTVEDFSQLDGLIDSLGFIMEKNSGCGLAAPQVGDSRKVLIAKINNNPKVFVNPTIENAKGYVPFLEGCLSFPGITVPTMRRYSIDLKYQDKNGSEIEKTFKGISAIVLQHEIDHLNGKLMFHYFR